MWAILAIRVIRVKGHYPFMEFIKNLQENSVAGGRSSRGLKVSAVGPCAVGPCAGALAKPIITILSLNSDS